jgi:hypothetical protein
MMLKTRATLKKSLANTAVTAAAVAVTLMKVLNARKLPRRLTSPAEIAKKLSLQAICTNM